jgi:hypothetical protein
MIYYKFCVKSKDNYILKGLDVWATGKLVIKKNDIADDLYMEQNFKRLLKMNVDKRNVISYTVEMIRIKV